MKLLTWKSVAILLLIITSFFSCRKHDILDTTPGLALSFSTDTLFFDTVFTSVGSVTQRLIVYNPNEKKLSVAKISLSGGTGSSYRMNVDGVAATETSDIEIPGGDSIFIFIKVTIDPANEAAPFVVKDSIRFETNGSQQFVNLMAWGRDANFYKNETIKGNVTWDSTRAHVIFGSLRIDTAASLTLLPGTKVYFHMGAYLAVSYQGSMKVLGTLDHKISFQGDRLDYFYRDLPGQWQGIFLEKGSFGHQFENVMIKNGVNGILIDKVTELSPPMLTLKNCIIRNMSSTGLYAYGSSVEGTNCLIADCGRACLDLTFGGSYDFRHLTIANYWYTTVRKIPSLYLSNYDYDTAGVKIFNPLVKAWFGNAIIDGNTEEELMFDAEPGTQFDYRFENSLLTTGKSISDPVHFESCLQNLDPKFVDIQKWDFHIDTLSPAIDKGKDLGIPFDLDGKTRINPPDLGAYEFIPRR